jgi:hypothetical protein
VNALAGWVSIAHPPFDGLEKTLGEGMLIVSPLNPSGIGQPADGPAEQFFVLDRASTFLVTE